jgi:hypothetical protein
MGQHKREPFPHDHLHSILAHVGVRSTPQHRPTAFLEDGNLQRKNVRAPRLNTLERLIMGRSMCGRSIDVGLPESKVKHDFLYLDF